MKRLAIVLGLVCCGTATAKADWEYTRWGMTPQQVASASKNLTKKGSDPRPDSDGNITKLVAPYKSGKFSFEAQFGFDTADRLSSVTLVLNDKSAGMDMAMGGDRDMNMTMDQGGCHALRDSVKAAYGTPHVSAGAHMQYGMETWQDQKSKNNVAYTVLNGSGCYVQYSVIKPAGAH